jgi:phage baseplate assembly protein W
MAVNSELNAQITNTYLGRGWKYPVSFSKESATVNLVEDEEDITESLIILLSTSLGERVMRHDYGSNLSDILFESINITTLTMISNRLKRAILFHEPRIKVEKIDITPNANEGLIEVSVDYTIHANNTRWNLVYPYYLNEGTNIEQ